MNLSYLSKVGRQQYVYFALSAALVAIFWAEGEQVNPVLVLLYTLCIGNLLSPAIGALEFLYAEKPFPLNWVLFLPVLVILAVPVYLIATAVVWLFIRPEGLPLTALFVTGWKTPFVATFLFGFISFLYRNTKERLERRNLELQYSVERGNAQIEMRDQELQRAREIQQSLLPREIPQIPGFAVAGAWQPASSVGGDYYDVLRLGDRRLGICIADVVGKGVSAALLMANVQAAVRALAAGSETPARVCSRVNNLLHENIASGKFVTFLYGILDGERRTFQYCNAGHLYPILVSGDSARMLDRGGGVVLGIFPGAEYADSTVELNRGDRLLLFTDGITEATDAEGHEFEEAKIASFAAANAALTANELTSRLLAHVTSYCGARFQDDATLLVIAAN